MRQHRLREIPPLCALLPGRRLTRLARATGSKRLCPQRAEAARHHLLIPFLTLNPLRPAPGGGAYRALPGLRVHRRLPNSSPDRCAASPPGNSPSLRPAPGGGAYRALPGLRVHRRLPNGSPDRCAASPPGNSPSLRPAPGGGAYRALPGLRVHRRLPNGSPDRCAASPPGMSPSRRQPQAPGHAHFVIELK